MIDIRTGKEMTRGGFLKGILASGIAPAITFGTASLAGSANGGVARGMMRCVGARQAAMFGGGWKNPYITDGLVSMWHAPHRIDASSNTWTDVVGNTVLNFGSTVSGASYELGDDFVEFNRYWAFSQSSIIHNVFTSGEFSIEYVADYSHTNPNKGWNIFSDSTAASGNGNYTAYIRRQEYATGQTYFYANGSGFWNGLNKTLPINGSMTVKNGVIKSYNNGVFTKQGGGGSSYQSNSVITIGGYYTYLRIGAIRIYSRELSASEVYDNFNTDKDEFSWL